MKRPSPPSHQAIVEANPELVARILIKFEGEFDPLLECWACGYRPVGLKKNKASGLERAHVIAHCAGGPNTPDNYFLLCGGCHRDQPDGASPDVQLIWLMNRAWESDWAWERTVALMVPVRAEAAALSADPEALLNAWAEYIECDILKILKTSNSRGGAWHVSNIMANHAYNLVDSLRQFSRLRPVSSEPAVSTEPAVAPRVPGAFEFVGGVPESEPPFDFSFFFGSVGINRGKLSPRPGVIWGDLRQRLSGDAPRAHPRGVVRGESGGPSPGLYFRASERPHG